MTLPCMIEEYRVCDIASIEEYRVCDIALIEEYRVSNTASREEYQMLSVDYRAVCERSTACCA